MPPIAERGPFAERGPIAKRGFPAERGFLAMRGSLAERRFLAERGFMSEPAAATFRANLDRVQERIARAAAAAGRDPDSVRLVAVSKYVDAATTRLAAEAGCLDLGESRPQALWAKAADPALSGLGIRWRMIGPLQRNKAARTLTAASSIDSVDSERLLRTLSDLSAAAGRVTPVLLEVNTSGEAAKHGFDAESLAELSPRLGEFPGVRAMGLMTMAPVEGGEPAARRAFAACRELRDLAARGLPELSMGMSGDFEAGIAEGATIVRIGSALWRGLTPEERAR